MGETKQNLVKAVKSFRRWVPDYEVIDLYKSKGGKGKFSALERRLRELRADKELKVFHRKHKNADGATIVTTCYR
jgi:hypothetical protein